ncbi:NACHT domain family [Coleofasciculus chthonoplastes PCC 7420]|uniref:NACHT domain family n=1 Tax=Coleofasciculus chthonoplastes PCC 7420 TaxID=118168 RepID=B4VVP5_9CYAN|nr:HEAT repeat domain-containing protein [Coleofasciculus chthonoplastes]EDX74012.1 NACHT domain family [Coleofasciculus chthonoplastes PCC 7420]
MDALVVWGVANAVGFVFGDVLKELAKGTLEDYTKDFFKDRIKALPERFNKEPLVKAVGKALKEFLQLVQEELETWGLSQEELKPYQGALKTFIHNKAVKQELSQAFAEGCRSLDGYTLAQTWETLQLQPLPAEFDWQAITQQYLRRVKAICRESDELRMILDSQNLEAIRDNTDAIAGIIPDFNLRQYRESLKEFYGYLKLETLDPGSYKYPMRLWQVFVPQTVREAMPLYDIPRDYLKRLQEANQLDEQISPEELEQYREMYYRQPIRSVLDILHQPSYPYLVILGDPGSGKSTLAQYVALDWAEKPTKTIPLLIELRNYARDRTLPKTFLEFIHQGAAAICHLNQHRLDEVLEAGDAFVLFDGLDEIFDPVARDTLITEIIRFTNQYPQVRVMVTSRIIGYKAQRLRDAQFRHFTLQDFEAEQIQAFVQKWHDLAFGNQPDKPRLQNRLQRAINESPAIRELAGNPLLLTMMAILNRNRELPRERAELYDEASRVLLHEWDIEKGLPPDEKLSPDTITRKEKQAMLRRVAYQMQAAPQGLAGNLITADELERILAGYLETLQDVEKPRTVSRLIIKQLRERNFILCFSGADCYSFVHRTFLEFFCAWEFVWQFKEKQSLSIEELKTEIFGKHWQDESWHEVLRLIAAMIDEQFVGEIIDYLIRQNGKLAKFRNLFLAAKCLTEVRSRSQISETATRLLNLLKKLSQWGDYKQLNQKQFSLITDIRIQAVATIASTWKEDSKTLHWLVSRLAQNDVLSVRQVILQEIIKGWKEHPNTFRLLRHCAQSHNNSDVRLAILKEIVKGWKEHPATLPWLKYCVYSDKSSRVREIVLKELVQNWHLSELARGGTDNFDPLTFLKAFSQSHGDAIVRKLALQKLLHDYKNDLNTSIFLKTCARSDGDATVRKFALQELARGWKNNLDTSTFLKACARSDGDATVRKFALQQLAHGWKDDPETLTFLKSCAQSDSDTLIKQTALQELAFHWKKYPDINIFILKIKAESDCDAIVRKAAIQELARGSHDNPDILTFLKSRAQSDEDIIVRQTAIQELARGGKNDSNVLNFVKEYALSDTDKNMREIALKELDIGWGNDPNIRVFIIKRKAEVDFKIKAEADLKIKAQSDRDAIVRKTAIQELARGGNGNPEILTFLKSCAQSDSDATVRKTAIQELARGGNGNPEILTFLKSCAQSDSDATVRKTAIKELATSQENNNDILNFLCRCAVKDTFDIYCEDLWLDNPRKTALEIIVKQYPHHPQTLKLLRNRIANDPDPNVQRFAREQLDKLRQKQTNAHAP